MPQEPQAAAVAPMASPVIGAALGSLYTRHARAHTTTTTTAPVAMLRRDGAGVPPALAVGDAMMLYSDAHNAILTVDGFLSSA